MSDTVGYLVRLVMKNGGKLWNSSRGLIFSQVLMNDLVESEGRASCRTCIGNNEGMFSFCSKIVLMAALLRQFPIPDMSDLELEWAAMAPCR
jgi:hypothetical protein